VSNPTNTTTALDLRTDKAAFEPATLTEALHVSQVLVASRLLPRSITTPEAAFAVIATGRELGLSAMQALRAIHIVEGKPTLSADLMVALVKKSEACLFFRMVESTGLLATYETHRRGEPGATRMSFSIEEAKAAGVATKDNWRKYPAAMLRARCAAALARAVYPDLVLGVYDPDELASPMGAPVVDVTPVPVAAPVVTVQPAPAAEPRRTRKAAPAPAPGPVVDAEVVEAPAVDAGLADALAAIAECSTIEAGTNVLEAARRILKPEALPTVFAALLQKASTLPEANAAAGVLINWKKEGVVIPDAQLAEMRAAYSARRDALRSEGGR
jgi:hypothetical protein